MLRKRLIFTLLYADGQFMLSRNFRLQKVGDIKWLEKNYNFSNVAFFIDELIVLDVSRTNRNFDAFCSSLSTISKGCFAPISAGGGIKTLEQARKLLRSGADKVVLNSALVENIDLVQSLAEEFGQQCVVGSVDLKGTKPDNYEVCINNGSKICNTPRQEIFKWAKMGIVGEIYLNSMDRDGTGQGYDFGTLSILPDCDLPVIMAGGVGNSKHLIEGLNQNYVDGVATANLFNFVGDGLQKARMKLKQEGINLATWETNFLALKANL